MKIKNILSPYLSDVVALIILGVSIFITYGMAKVTGDIHEVTLLLMVTSEVSSL